MFVFSDAISESNPRLIDDTRARKLASDLKRCAYYETCATYGLNVERVFQDGASLSLLLFTSSSRQTPRTASTSSESSKTVRPSLYFSLLPHLDKRHVRPQRRASLPRRCVPLFTSLYFLISTNATYGLNVERVFQDGASLSLLLFTSLYFSLLLFTSSSRQTPRTASTSSESSKTVRPSLYFSLLLFTSLYFSLLPHLDKRHVRPQRRASLPRRCVPFFTSLYFLISTNATYGLNVERVFQDGASLSLLLFTSSSRQTPRTASTSSESSKTVRPSLFTSLYFLISTNATYGLNVERVFQDGASLSLLLFTSSSRQTPRTASTSSESSKTVRPFLYFSLLPHLDKRHVRPQRRASLPRRCVPFFTSLYFLISTNASYPSICLMGWTH